MKKFIKICKKEQKDLKKWLAKLLKAKYKEVINEDGFLYARGDGNTPILLTAHMDTVHKEKCTNVVVEKHEEKTIISSPQGIGGDDRCGIWMIYMILTKTKYRPSILFCEDEEIGGVGSDKFTRTEYIKELEDLKYLVELDRANANDAVYYNCGNVDFEEYIETITGYKINYGSFSDISHLSPDCDKASVNLSCGYYKAHTVQEYVIFEEMFNTFKTVKKLCADAKNADAYDYQYENPYSRYSYDNLFRSSYYDFYDDDDEYDKGYKLKNYGNVHNIEEEEYESFEYTFEFNYLDENGEEQVDYIDAKTLEAAYYTFFVTHPTRCYNDVLYYQRYNLAS
jgi:hypothetical protein